MRHQTASSGDLGPLLPGAVWGADRRPRGRAAAATARRRRLHPERGRTTDSLGRCKIERGTHFVILEAPGTALSVETLSWAVARTAFPYQRRKESHMSRKAAEHHRKASEHHTQAAHHHGEAAKHHESGQHEKAGHHANAATGMPRTPASMVSRPVERTPRSTERNSAEGASPLKRVRKAARWPLHVGHRGPAGGCRLTSNSI